jgi:hypothetical protein
MSDTTHAAQPIQVFEIREVIYQTGEYSACYSRVGGKIFLLKGNPINDAEMLINNGAFAALGVEHGISLVREVHPDDPLFSELLDYWGVTDIESLVGYQLMQFEMQVGEKMSSGHITPAKAFELLIKWIGDQVAPDRIIAYRLGHTAGFSIKYFKTKPTAEEEKSIEYDIEFLSSETSSLTITCTDFLLRLGYPPPR